MGLERDISKNLKTLRHERGISQRELAEATGLDEKFISQLENKPRHISTKTLERLAQGLGVNEGHLLGKPKSSNDNGELSPKLAPGLDEAIKILKMHRARIKDR